MSPENNAYDVLDALSQSIVVLDKHGTIVFANNAWKDFGKYNGAPSDFIGTKYLDHCNGDCPGPEAEKVSDGIERLLGGRTSSFAIDYPCHSPLEQRWYTMTATPLDRDHKEGIIVVHDNITERVLAEQANRVQKEKLSLIVNNVDAALFGIDITLLQQYFNTLKKIHTGSFLDHIHDKPEFLRETSGLIRIVDISDRAVSMYRAGSAKKLLSYSPRKLFFKTSVRPYINSLNAIYNDETGFAFSTIQQDLTGKKFDALVKLAFPSDSDHRNWLLVCVIDITDLKNNEKALIETDKALKKQLAFTSSLLDTIPMPVSYQNRKGMFLGCNSAFESFTGISKNVLKGKKTSDFFPEPLSQHFSCSGHTKPHPSEDLDILTPEGPRNVVLNKANFKDSAHNVSGCITVFNDITDRLNYEKSLQGSEKQFRDLAEHSHNIIVIRNNKKILYANPRFKILLEYGENEVFSPAFPYSKIFVQEQSNGKVSNNADALSEIQLVTKSGRKLTCIGRNASIDFDGQSAIMGIYTDITPFKELEKKYRESQKLNALGTLAGGIAHDFNNIIASILGYASMTLDDLEENSLAHKNTATIIDASRRAQALVEQILSFSRDSTGPKKRISLRQVILEALRFIKPLIPSSITLVHQVTCSSCYVDADPSKIQQIIINMLTNAKQAIEGTGTITLSLKDEEMQGTLHGNHATITISDTGKGIPEKHLDRIFEPFFTTKQAGKGTGLGLAAVYGIISDLDGDITVKSTEGKGSTFTISIPLTTGQPAATPEPSTYENNYDYR